MRSQASVAQIAAVPFLAIGSLAWICTPTSASGRALVTGSIGAILALIAWASVPQRRVVAIARDALLEWQPGRDSDDSYRVALWDGKTLTTLLEHDNPAVVLREARRIAEATGARLSLPSSLDEGRAHSGAQGERLEPLREVGLVWATQRRAAWATLGGAAFVLVSFLGSIRAESGLSLLSAALPLASVAAGSLIGAALLSLRVHVTFDEKELVAAHVLFGHRREILRLASSPITRVTAVGHRGFPPRHLLVETHGEPIAFAFAGAAAQSVAEALRRALGAAQ